QARPRIDSRVVSVGEADAEGIVPELIQASQGDALELSARAHVPRLAGRIAMCAGTRGAQEIERILETPAIRPVDHEEMVAREPGPRRMEIHDFGRADQCGE